jgi:hypothetical protein
MSESDLLPVLLCTACDRRVYRVPQPQGSRTGLRHWPNGDDGEQSSSANPGPPPDAYTPEGA